MNKTTPVRINTTILNKIRKTAKGNGFTVSGLVNLILSKEMKDFDNGSINYFQNAAKKKLSKTKKG